MLFFIYMKKKNPLKILIPRFDTMGDIILIEGLIESLIAKFEEPDITLLVRSEYEQLYHLFPHNLKWLTISIHPYIMPSMQDVKELVRLFNNISQHSFDMILITTFNRTWIDDILASKFKETYIVAFGEYKPIKGRYKWIYDYFGLQVSLPFDKCVSADRELQETWKYSLFLDELDGKSVVLKPSRLHVDLEHTVKAEKVLNRNTMNRRPFFICLPGGNMNIPIKIWPSERYAAAISQIVTDYDMLPLIVGHESESSTVLKLSNMLTKENIETHYWIGKPGEIPVLAALIRKAQLYFGNDTGALHLACALGIPSVAIFGGGHWPRFLPEGKKSIGVAVRTPCFSCDWDCAFEDAPCIRLVTVEDALLAVKKVMDNHVESNRIFFPDRLSMETEFYMEKAYRKHLALKSVLNDTIDKYESEK